MRANRASLILPVENQVRELEAKVLLACVAAERGFRVFVGSRREVEFRMASFPRSIYLGKSLTNRSKRVLRMLRKLGHGVAALDEEGAVHYQPEQYYARRISPKTLAEVSTLLAWGPDNAELFHKHPAYAGTPVFITGNPRGDFLRRELRPLFQDEIDRIRARHGDFILVNTNFSGVNAYLEIMNFLRPGTEPGDPERFGKSGTRYSPEFAEGLAAHKAALFEHFKRMVPALAAAFPDRAIVVRPHPSERREPWEEATASLGNVDVVHKGNVVPWLCAASVLIHNGCTTAVEAFALQVPAVTYQPVTAEAFDLALPNALSYGSHDLEELCDAVARVLRGERDYADTPERHRLLDQFIAARTGPLASDRIVDALLPRAQQLLDAPRPWLPLRLFGRIAAANRRRRKRKREAQEGDRNDPRYQQHRYQGIALADLRIFHTRLRAALGRFDGLEIRALKGGIFEFRG
ncbi:MAG: hypothetical protein O7G30_13430 [Proteobacteria bacterium]|nr:hypothetical protein [Pseudomonadota bacterium]